MIITTYSITSCKKDLVLTTEIKGVVKDYYSGDVVKNKNIPINIVFEDIEKGYTSEVSDVIEVDENGGFYYSDTYEMKKAPDAYYYLFVNSDKTKSPKYKFKIGGAYETEVYTRPTRCLKVAFKKVSASKYERILFAYSDNHYSESLLFNSTNKDTVCILKIMPDNEYWIRAYGYEDKNDDRSVQLTWDTIYLENVDTTYYEITY